MTGHALGAAGAIEAVISVLAIRDQCAPPTINLDDPDPACDLDYVPHQAREMEIHAALSNSFGFGGTNGPSSSNAGRTNPDKSFLYRGLAVMSVLLLLLLC